MIRLAAWLLAGAVLLGIGLACLWLMERRPGGWARAASLAHGAAAAAGTALALAALLAGVQDAQGLGSLAAWFLGFALTGGLAVLAAQLLRRRPSGLIVALHATLGIAGFVLLLAYVSVAH